MKYIILNKSRNIKGKVVTIIRWQNLNIGKGKFIQDEGQNLEYGDILFNYQKDKRFTLSSNWSMDDSLSLKMQQFCSFNINQIQDN